MNVYSEISDLVRCKLIMFIFKHQWADLAPFLQMGVDLALLLENGGRFGNSPKKKQRLKEKSRISLIKNLMLNSNHNKCDYQMSRLWWSERKTLDARTFVQNVFQILQSRHCCCWKHYDSCDDQTDWEAKTCASYCWICWHSVEGSRKEWLRVEFSMNSNCKSGITTGYFLKLVSHSQFLFYFVFIAL